MNNNKLDYRSSGVDIKAGEKAVETIREMVKSTYNPNVLSELGSFGGLYRFDSSSYTEPILVSSTDGVGTKIRIAIEAQKWDTVGQDLVNHCVNDILVQGAEPLFFLDCNIAVACNGISALVNATVAGDKSSVFVSPGILYTVNVIASSSAGLFVNHSAFAQDSITSLAFALPLSINSLTSLNEL